MTPEPLPKIRRAQLKDVHPIHLLILDATKRGKILKRSTREITKNIHHFWVLEKNKNIVGCCALEIYNKKLAEIRSLSIHAEEQKKGLASLLVQRCVAEAKKKKVYEVFAITNRENLFKRAGFSEQLHDQKPLFLRP